ncbi:MAG: dockerin type I repeat-containing protein [Bacilli bacterium]
MKKFMKILVIFCVSMVIGISNIDAKERNNITFVPDKTECNTGDYITFKLSSKFLNDEVNSLVGNISYDTSVFEYVLPTNFKLMNNWDNLFYNSLNGSFSIINTKGFKKGDIFSITLKVKKDTIIGQSNVNIESLSMSTGKKELNIKDDDLLNNISIIKNNNLPGVIETGKELTNFSYITKVSNTVLQFVLYLFLIILELLVLIWFLKKILNNKKINKKVFKVANLLVFSVIFLQLILVSIGAYKTLDSKGDINNDKSVNNDDIILVQKYLVGLNNINNKDLKYVDVDINGKISINDLGKIIRKVNK